MSTDAPETPIGDYAVLSDCHTAALVSRDGSIDWFCAPRFDAGSFFGALLDSDRGGRWRIGPRDRVDVERAYVDETLVLETTFSTAQGTARLIDCLLAPPLPGRARHRRLLRVVEGVDGAVELDVRFAPRFDYGDVDPWLRPHGDGAFAATGGNDALVLWTPAELAPEREGVELHGQLTVETGERVPFLLATLAPEELESESWESPAGEEIDEALEQTLDWWRDWADRLHADGADAAAVRRSAITLKALSYAPTGAMVAAATTSLPEAPHGARNWDYRFSWIRDSVLASRSLAEVGCDGEADEFRRFIERSTAGKAGDLTIAYGVGGERRIGEEELDHLAGYGGARPVRIGNDAATQLQLDAYGHIVLQAWSWHERGHSPEKDYWAFLVTVVDAACELWERPDAGIWEWRGDGKHFVHSKAMCWAAVDRGLELAGQCSLEGNEQRWEQARDAIRAAIERDGYDDERGVFVQAFGTKELDAALLRLPAIGFVDFDDERMVRTTDAIMESLAVDEDGLVRRYKADDGLEGTEGAFVPCSFWLAAVLARQGRAQLARRVFDRAVSTASDLGLFSEEYDAEGERLLGNYPQALTHLSHIEAWRALSGGA